jgi:anti-sigma factor RsiW
MGCPDEQTLTAFADGELPPRQAADVEQHLTGCQACAEAVQDLGQLNALGRSALTRIPVTAARRTLPDVRPRRFVSIAAGMSAAAAVLIGALAAQWLLTRPSAGGSIARPISPNATLPHVELPEPTPLLDAEFARWSAEYQSRRIPRVPLEQLADYHPTPVFPVLGPDAEHL